MRLLREQVQCYFCKDAVDKANTRIIEKVKNEYHYQCFRCFQRNKTSLPQNEQFFNRKISLLCERCKYQFKSKRLICPYCNKSDFISKGDIKVEDLL